MTPLLAHQLLLWLQTSTVVSVTPAGTPPTDPLVLRLLPERRPENQALIELLLAQVGVEHLHRTPQGAGLPAQRVGDLADQARRVLAEASVPSVPPAVPPAQTPSTAPPLVRRFPPATVRKRYGFEPWVVCDAAEAAALLEAAPPTQRERRRLLEALVKRPVRYRPITTQAHVQSVLHFRNDFPHFQEVIETLADELTLQARMKAPLQLPPTLLLGPPGLGKTTFVDRLAQRLGFQWLARSLAEMSAGFLIAGGSSSWAEGQPGIIANLVATLPDDKVPLVLFDEVDKARPVSSYPADAILLGLLEPATARRFHDENLNLALNVEPVTWMLTANHRPSIRPEILSRVRQTNLPRPTRDQMPAVVRSVDQALRQEMPALDRCFEPLSDAVIRCLAQSEPRSLRAMLRSTYARVARRHPDGRGVLTLAPQDFERSAVESSAAPARTMGSGAALLVAESCAGDRIH